MLPVAVCGVRLFFPAIHFVQEGASGAVLVGVRAQTGACEVRVCAGSGP